MEMEAINKEDEQHKDKMGDGKQLMKDEEEAEVAHYSSLVKPQEDVYAEAFQTDKSAETEVTTKGNTQVYRIVCVILSVICLILLMAVIFLCTKLPAGSAVCPELESTTPPSTCSKQICQTFYNIPSKESLQCDKNWPSFGGSCYFLSTTRMNWSQSQSYCFSRGGSLAVIKSPAVQDFLSKQGGLMYWIGLSQSNGTWTWVDNTVLQERYWAEEEPHGDCVYLKTGGNAEKNWFREYCHQHSYFICQKQIHQ